MSLKVLQIVPGTSVDGPGLRTSVYLAGCSHGCPGCHNPASWDFNGGQEMEAEEVAEIVLSHGFNMTLTGGDPLLHSDLDAIEALIRLVKAQGKTVWVYTGFLYEQARNKIITMVACEIKEQGDFGIGKNGLYMLMYILTVAQDCPANHDQKRIQ